jgi:hypothetical protein
MRFGAVSLNFDMTKGILTNENAGSPDRVLAALISSRLGW